MSWDDGLIGDVKSVPTVDRTRCSAHQTFIVKADLTNESWLSQSTERATTIAKCKSTVIYVSIAKYFVPIELNLSSTWKQLRCS